MKGTWETRITSDTYSPTQETQSLVICVPLPRKHISLVICVPLPRKHISLVISVPLPRKHIFLVIHVPLPGKQISLVICVPLPWETHITRDMCFLGRGRDMCFPGRGTCITWWYMFPTYGAHISLGICVYIYHWWYVICVPLPGKDIFLVYVFPTRELSIVLCVPL